MLQHPYNVDVTRGCHHNRCSVMWWSHQTQSSGALPHCMGLGTPGSRSRPSCGQTSGWGGPGVESRCQCSSLSSAVMWHGEICKHLSAPLFQRLVAVSQAHHPLQCRTCRDCAETYAL